MSFKPSIYQEAIFEHIKNSNQNAVIEAVAGSGKTTTLIESMKLVNSKNIIFVAFNKHIAEDIKPKVSKDIRVSTMHSFGYEQILRSYGKVTLDNFKIKKIIQDKHHTLNVQYSDNSFDYISDLSSLVDLLRLNLCNSHEEAVAIANKYSFYNNSEYLVEDAFKVIRESNRIRKSIDFVDMIYIPAIEDIKIKEFDLVLVDECQDLSKCQIQLVNKMKKNDGRIIAVGDRNQAIYGFTGADHESFKTLSEAENTILLPLSISYRCSKSVIREAQKIVPHIKYFKNAIEGSVNRTSNLNNILDGDFILCRINAPLVSLAMKFISSGRKASVKGVDIGLRIINNLKSTKQNDVKSALKILRKRYDDYKLEYESSHDRKVKTKLTAMEDMINTTEILSLSPGCYTIDDVSKIIKNVFNDTESKGLILSSAHKSKGLETDNVHIIKPEFMPLPHISLPWEKEQEDNLHYVAITRAKKNLNYIIEY
jgi:DNA helicase-2/ATP-dependent DNA helicase PcrA